MLSGGQFSLNIALHIWRLINSLSGHWPIGNSKYYSLESYWTRQFTLIIWTATCLPSVSHCRLFQKVFPFILAYSEQFFKANLCSWTQIISMCLNTEYGELKTCDLHLTFQKISFQFLQVWTKSSKYQLPGIFNVITASSKHMLLRFF